MGRAKLLSVKTRILREEFVSTQSVGGRGSPTVCGGVIFGALLECRTTHTTASSLPEFRIRSDLLSRDGAPSRAPSLHPHLRPLAPWSRARRLDLFEFPPSLSPECPGCPGCPESVRAVSGRCPGVCPGCVRAVSGLCPAVSGRFRTPQAAPRVRRCPECPKSVRVYHIWK